MLHAMHVRCYKNICICQYDGPPYDPSANAVDKQRFRLTIRAQVHNILKYWMMCAIQLAKKETCVRARQLGEFIFRCIISPRLALFSSTQELANWAEFLLENEEEDYTELGKSIRDDTRSEWSCNMQVWFDSIHTKPILLHNSSQTTIREIIAFKIQQYMHLWKMPHVVMRNPQLELRKVTGSSQLPSSLSRVDMLVSWSN